jgi:hypothetical protein
MYSRRVSAKLKCPVRAKLKCPNYPSEDEVREAEIGLGDDERTRTATHRGSFEFRAEQKRVQKACAVRDKGLTFPK